MQTMYYIGLDIHKRTVSYCVKDGSGTIHAGGAIPATRFDLDRWIKKLPHLRPHAAALKVAHPLMLRAIAVAKKKALPQPAGPADGANEEQDRHAAPGNSVPAHLDCGRTTPGIWTFGRNDDRPDRGRTISVTQRHSIPTKRMRQLFTSGTLSRQSKTDRCQSYPHTGSE